MERAAKIYDIHHREEDSESFRPNYSKANILKNEIR